MRNYALFYVNGKRVQVTGDDLFLPLAEFLRKRLGLVGTKIVCSEGDCGACTILRSRYIPNSRPEHPITLNACISFVFQNDLTHIFTVEALENETGLHPVQKSLIESHGSQCGFCTPGIVMSLAGIFESGKIKKVSSDIATSALVGNLCRCTGYRDIVCAGENIKLESKQTLLKRYHSKSIDQEFKKHKVIPILCETDNYSFNAPLKIKEAASLKSKGAKIVSGGTDLGVLFNKEKLSDTKFLSLHLIGDLYKATKNSIGANTTLTEMETLVEVSRQTLSLFASPQIRNIGTVAGNVINASPIADLVPLLIALNGKISLAGRQKTRIVPIDGFYLGYKKLNLKSDEIVTRISFDLPKKNEIVKSYKVSRRKDLDIATINAVMRFTLKGKTIESTKLVFGGVGPTAIRAYKTEKCFNGKRLNETIFTQASEVILQEITPITDVRASKETRLKLAKNLFKKCFAELLSEKRV